ncbi:hypothetical protein EDB87DRAFT_778322 [Lactarius vividus]|nr:hypothetical protein EDB87DRAFT_778322 [Lactarius vividus]
MVWLAGGLYQPQTVGPTAIIWILSIDISQPFPIYQACTQPPSSWSRSLCSYHSSTKLRKTQASHDPQPQALQRNDIEALLVYFTLMHGLSPAVPEILYVRNCKTKVQEVHRRKAEGSGYQHNRTWWGLECLAHLKHLRPMTSTLPFRSAGSRESLPWYTPVHLCLLRAGHRTHQGWLMFLVSFKLLRHAREGACRAAGTYEGAQRTQSDQFYPLKLVKHASDFRRARHFDRHWAGLDPRNIMAHPAGPISKSNRRPYPRRVTRVTETRRRHLSPDSRRHMRNAPSAESEQASARSCMTKERRSCSTSARCTRSSSSPPPALCARPD